MRAKLPDTNLLKDFWTIEEFCREAQISRQALGKRWRKGTGPRRVILPCLPGRVFLVRKEGAAWIKANPTRSVFYRCRVGNGTRFSRL